MKDVTLGIESALCSASLQPHPQPHKEATELSIDRNLEMLKHGGTEANERSEPDWDQTHTCLNDLRDWFKSSDGMRERLSDEALRMVTDALDNDITDGELISRFLWSITRLSKTMDASDAVPPGETWRVTIGSLLEHRDIEDFTDELAFNMAVWKEELDRADS